MTTDITELAQREKFEAWWEREYKHLESSKYTDAVPHIKYGFWMAYQAGGAELVEALEKSESRLHEVAVACATAEQELEKAQQQITQLESRTVTVKLSKYHVDDADLFGWGVVVVPLEALKDACANAGVTVEIADDGIKVEVE